MILDMVYDNAMDDIPFSFMFYAYSYCLDYASLAFLWVFHGYIVV